MRCDLWFLFCFVAFLSEEEKEKQSSGWRKTPWSFSSTHGEVSRYQSTCQSQVDVVAASDPCTEAEAGTLGQVELARTAEPGFSERR